MFRKLCNNKPISFIIRIIFAMINVCVMVSKMAWRVFTRFSNLMLFVWYHIIYKGNTSDICLYLSYDAYTIKWNSFIFYFFVLGQAEITVSNVTRNCFVMIWFILLYTLSLSVQFPVCLHVMHTFFLCET